jgi:hypothetical protein
MIALMSGSLRAAACHDGWARSVEIGGDRISAYASKGGKPLRFATVRLYSGMKLLGTYRTNSEGGFNIYNFSEGAYKVTVKGLGTATVQINPQLTWATPQQQASWSIMLSDHGCAGAGATVG